MQLWIERWQEGQIHQTAPGERYRTKRYTIEQLKGMIWAHDTEYVVERQKLVFNGTELRDNDCTCSQYVVPQKKRKRGYI